MKSSTQLDVAGRKLPVSNLDKVLYPKPGFTKGDVIDYYMKASKALLPHLKDRALTLKRYPNGVDKEFFYEKRCPRFRPPWVKTAPIWSEANHETIDYCLANDLPSLVWAANLADLELHTSLALYQKPARPTVMVFDLDPGPGTNVVDCAKISLALRDILKRHSLKSFAKTSGSKGLQVYVPLNSPTTFDETKACSRAIAERIVREIPDLAVAQMSKRLRNKKVFIDWVQNDDHKTTVCVYSLRARERPTASTPLKWSEIETALASGRESDLVFEGLDVIKRIGKFGDLFAPVLTLKQKLPPLEKFAAD